MVKIYSPKNFIALLISVLFTAVIFLGCKKNTDAVSTTEQYIKYTINGVSYSFMKPVDTFYHATTYNLMSLAIFGDNLISPSNNVSLVMANTGIAVGSNQNLIVFSPSQITDILRVTIPIFVNITEYGAVGQFIAGGFTGVFTGFPPANIQYNVTCTFRVRR